MASSSSRSNIDNPLNSPSSPPLVQSLYRDLGGKRTAQECLRTKVFPAKEVRDVLRHHQKCRTDDTSVLPPLDETAFRISQCYLLSGALVRLQQLVAGDDTRDQMVHSKNFIKPNNETVRFLEDLTVVVHFLQLLLECSTTTCTLEEDDDTQDFSSAPIVHGMSEKEFQRMAIQLLRGLVGALCSEPRQPDQGSRSLGTVTNLDCSVHDKQEWDTFLLQSSQSPCLSAIVGYGWTQLIRLNTYARSDPRLLSPLWKGLARISQRHPTIILVQSNGILWNKAMDLLLEYLEEGSKMLLPSNTDCNVDQSVPSTALQILSFLLGRIQWFLELASSDAPTEDRHDKCILERLSFVDDHNEKTCSSALRLVEQLCLWIGYEKSFCNSTEQKNFDMVESIGRKSQLCFNALFEGTVRVNSTARALLEKTLSNVHAEPTHFRKQKCQPIVVGKRILTLQLLRQRIALTTLGANEDGWQSLLQLCHSMLWEALPSILCDYISDLTHSNITSEEDKKRISRMENSSGSSYLSDLHQIIEVLTSGVECARDWATSSGKVEKFNSFLDRLVLRWLGQASCGECKQGIFLSNKLTKEILLILIPALVVNLVLTERGRKGASDIHLHQLLTALLLDSRTHSKLRSIIASVLVRLERYHCVPTGDLVDRILHTATRCSSYSSTRKRKRAAQTWHNKVTLDESDWSSVARVAKTFQRTTKLPRICSSTEACRLPRSLQICVEGESVAWERVENLHLGNLEDPKMVVATQIVAFRQIIRFGSSGPTLSGSRTQTLLSLAHGLAKRPKMSSKFILVFLKVLGSMGGRLPRELDTRSQDHFAEIFKGLLSESRSWACRASVMTSLVSLASSVPTSCKGMVRASLPARARALMQTRVQKCLFEDPKGSIYVFTDHLRSQSGRMSVQGKQLLACLDSPSNLTIQSESFVVTMPTQDGREAIVIFGPGRESLEDIQYMMDQDSDCSPSFRKLRRVQLVSSTSCRLFLGK